MKPLITRWHYYFDAVKITRWRNCLNAEMITRWQFNGNNVHWVSNAKHLGNVVDDKLSDLKDINAETVILLRVLTGLWATSEAKCLLNVIFDYLSHIAAPIMAQCYGHYMIEAVIEVLTIFA